MIRMVRGGGRRKGQLDLLPSLDVGWTHSGPCRGIDLGVAFGPWYAYVEVWLPDGVA